LSFTSPSPSVFNKVSDQKENTTPYSEQTRLAHQGESHNQNQNQNQKQNWKNWKGKGNQGKQGRNKGNQHTWTNNGVGSSNNANTDDVNHDTKNMSGGDQAASGHGNVRLNRLAPWEVATDVELAFFN
jgi:hypothetical protein